MKEVRNNVDDDTELVLFINKSDLEDTKVSFSEAQKYAESEGMIIYQTSAKTGKNVTGAFLEICKKLMEKK